MQEITYSNYIEDNFDFKQDPFIEAEDYDETEEIYYTEISQKIDLIGELRENGIQRQIKVCPGQIKVWIKNRVFNIVTDEELDVLEPAHVEAFFTLKLSRYCISLYVMEEFKKFFMLEDCAKIYQFHSEETITIRGFKRYLGFFFSENIFSLIRLRIISVTYTMKTFYNTSCLVATIVLKGFKARSKLENLAQIAEFKSPNLYPFVILTPAQIPTTLKSYVEAYLTQEYAKFDKEAFEDLKDMVEYKIRTYGYDTSEGESDIDEYEFSSDDELD
ncbi:hypothetical protein [Carp edema virus]|nr:hypothetical protein [Carp edema virus]